MKRFKTAGWILALAWMAGMMITRQPVGVPVKRSVKATTAGSRGNKPGTRLPPALRDGDEPRASAKAEQKTLSIEARVALVVTRLREWEDEDDPELRPQRTQELEELLAGPDRLKILGKLPATQMDFAFGLPSFQQWMRAEPKSAADWIGSHPDISGARVLTLLQVWGEKNRDEMRQYFSSLPEGEWKQKVMVAACHEAIARDPVEAIAWARQMKPDDAQMGLLELAVVEWAKSDPTAATRWMTQQPDSELREHLTGSLAAAYADVEPVLAAEWVLQSVRPGIVSDRSIAEIAGAWAKQEPAAAGDWVARFPAGNGRQRALGNLMNIWGNRDRTAAAAWAQALADETLRTQATELLAALPVPTRPQGTASNRLSF